MEILKRDEFKKLLEDNPGRKFAFYHYLPYTFLGDIHITTGDIKGSSFRSWSPNPTVKDEAPDFGSFSTSDLLIHYAENDLFAVLDDADIMFMLLRLKTVTGDAQTPNELRVEEGLPPVGNLERIRVITKETHKHQENLIRAVSNLIADMTVRGANEKELEVAIEFSKVAIDAIKHELG